MTKLKQIPCFIFQEDFFKLNNVFTDGCTYMWGGGENKIQTDGDNYALREALKIQWCLTLNFKFLVSDMSRGTTLPTSFSFLLLLFYCFEIFCIVIAVILLKVTCCMNLDVNLS